MLRFLTSGESHGKCLVAILEGMIAGLMVDVDDINRELARRQEGYGRSGRMTVEKDQVEVLSGLRFKKTFGAPIGLLVPNRDFRIDLLPVIKRPRPGHADLPGAIKYARRDIRDILERASARETVARVAVGAICKIFLREFGVDVISHVVCVDGVWADTGRMSFDQIRKASLGSPMHCADKRATAKMIARVDAARRSKNTLGGIFEVIARGVPAGIGSYAHYDRRLSSKLCAAVVSIQAVKGVEIGMGFGVATARGRSAHDEIFYDRKKGFYRRTNRAGGLEGGITNGENLVLRAAMKPIATLMNPLCSVNIDTKQKELATVERSDVTAVPACGVVAEAMVAFTLAQAFLEKFGGDSLPETKRNYAGYRRQLDAF